MDLVTGFGWGIILLLVGVGVICALTMVAGMIAELGIGGVLITRKAWAGDRVVLACVISAGILAAPSVIALTYLSFAR